MDLNYQKELILLSLMMNFIQIMMVLISIIIIKKILLYLKKWDSRCLDYQSLGQEFIQTGEEEKPNQAGLDFYRNVFTELRNAGIEPLVSIWHFDTPLALEEKYGDWLDRKYIALYEKYVTTIFNEYKGLVKYWLTFNEINNTINFLPDNASDEAYQEAYQHLHYQFVASARAVQIGHQIDPENKIGCMICGITYYPLTSDPEDILFNRSKWEKGIFYCGDVQCKGKYPTYAKRLWKEHNVKLDITETKI